MRENQRESENQREADKKDREDSAIERKSERKKNFYAKVSEVKRAMLSNQPMIVLLYKEAFLNTNELDSSLPSSIVSLLQEYDDVFPEETPHGLPPIRGMNIKSILFPVQQFQTDQHIGAIPRRPRSFNGK